MVGGVNSAMQDYFSLVNTGGVQAASKLYGYSVSNRQGQAMVQAFRQSNDRITALGEGTADFLKQYTAGLNDTAKAARAVAENDFAAMARDDAGNVAAKTVDKSVDAVRGMVDSYNASLQTLRDNAGRGSGVQDVQTRMTGGVQVSTELEEMGLSVNEDGTLALDEERLAETLRTADDEQLARLDELMRGEDGLAGTIRQSAKEALKQPAGRLVENDLAKMQSAQAEDPVRNYAMGQRGGGAYAMNNNAALGMMMNMLV